MTDSISQLGKASVQVNTGADKVKSRPAETSAPQAPETAVARPGADEIVLSAEVENALASAEFDATKVARIKEAIDALSRYGYFMYRAENPANLPRDAR